MTAPRRYVRKPGVIGFIVAVVYALIGLVVVLSMVIVKLAEKSWPVIVIATCLWFFWRGGL